MVTGKVLLWMGEENDVVKVFTDPNVSKERVKEVAEECIVDSGLGENFELAMEYYDSYGHLELEYQGDFGTARFMLEDVDIE